MKRAVWFGGFGVLGGVAAWLLMPARAPRSAEVTNATLDGHGLPAGDSLAAADTARQAMRAWLDQKVTLVVAGTRVERTREQLGARIDSVHLESLLAELRDANSALRLSHSRSAPDVPLALPLPYALDSEAALAALMQVKDELDVAPVDAHYDFSTKKVSPDQPGRLVDAWATLARIDDALACGAATVDAVVQTAAAHRVATQLADVSTEAVLGWFETKYARDQKHEARTFNLRLAASKLDGFVLLPGETFDFNRIVGARNEVNGYKVAPVIAQGSSSTASVVAPARSRAPCMRPRSSQGWRSPSASPTRGRASTSRWASTRPSRTPPSRSISATRTRFRSFSTRRSKAAWCGQRSSAQSERATSRSAGASTRSSPSQNARSTTKLFRRGRGS